MGGDIYFDECYEGNPLVNALCAGILRHEDIQKGAATGVGNPVYYVGPGTGRDGLGERVLPPVNLRRRVLKTVRQCRRGIHSWKNFCLRHVWK